MEPVPLSYKGTNSIHTINILAAYKDGDGKFYLVREGLNSSIYMLESSSSEALLFGIESPLRQTKKILNIPCGEKFSIKGKCFIKLLRLELVGLLDGRLFKPMKVDEK